MATKSIFDCESFDAPQEPTRQLISYDEDLFTFESETGIDEIDSAPTNVSISVKIDNNGTHKNGKRKAQNMPGPSNGRIFKKPKLDVMNIKVSTNGGFRQVIETDKKSKEYELGAMIGCGTYGQVFKARWNVTTETIAVKRLSCKLNTPNTDKTLEFIKREYDHLMEVRDCPFIVQLFKGCEQQISKNDLQLDLLFEYCRHDLKRIIETPTISFRLNEIKAFLRQMLIGLDYMHNKLIMHRDFKTENILLTIDGVVKIADFGLSRKISDPEASLAQNKLTPNMCTQWYRAPEILLGDRQYNESADMWSLACIIGEFWYRHAILPGENEIHQIKLISKLCGSLKPETWPNIVNLKLYQQIINFPKHVRCTRSFLKCKLPKVPDEHANDFFDKMLQCNPQKRLSACKALNDNFFYKHPLPSRSLKPFMERSIPKLCR